MCIRDRVSTQSTWGFKNTMEKKKGEEEKETEKMKIKGEPTIFQELQDYVAKKEDAWCTPGHQGGIGFLRNDIGEKFYKFFGENIFKADVSSSMSEIGSILSHGEAMKHAERKVKEIFGSDFAHLVSNGTTTSNKLVFMATTSNQDKVFVDRNCHKSIVQSLIMTSTSPTYLRPERNDYGIIGPITQDEIREKITGDPALVVITNSTYDGLCYDVEKTKNNIGSKSETILFDEAWYGHAIFSPLYAKRYAMSNVIMDSKEKSPTVFATQSTHKLLSAFSMASVVLIKSGKGVRFVPDSFEETWMMHTSTSPFYPLLASIEVGTQMMEGARGKKIVADMLTLAVQFRKRMASLGPLFSAWQPDTFGGSPIGKVTDDDLISKSDLWVLKPGEKWHGFKYTAEDNIMLDPLKLTILTQGIKDGKMEETGVPALIVAKYLAENKIVVEKVGYYNILFLFGPGASKDKCDNLYKVLADFKQLYEKKETVEKMLPLFATQYPKYAKMQIQDLCNDLHKYLRDRNIIKLVHKLFSDIPEMRITPASAYQSYVRNVIYNKTPEQLKKDYTEGKKQICAVLLAAYPPGIPIMMPGEYFSEGVIDYLLMNEKLDNDFPGFDIEIHGVIKTANPEKVQKTHYEIPCVEITTADAARRMESKMRKHITKVVTVAKAVKAFMGLKK
eukprot:TRINITY_DN322_c1_g1_i1.p1 TRINITY_DN322_c1_g1~~TRINITY_DN322_c1_g1_i1.p1  ORF type:complete len:673 (+),score=115.70 TRINITY_DN322_c1_g1_i1:65-2083(+)